MSDKTVFITKPSMPLYEEYIEMIKPLWESRLLTNMGKYHRELEEQVKTYLDVPELSLMVNGHMALEMAIQAFHFPENSEVITTPFTFVSTTHAIVRNNLKPVFCDVKLCDGTIDETKIEELITNKTVAIIPVHVYGNVCNVEKLQKIADKNGLRLIYDAAHAFGVKYRGKGIGAYGDASIFSFHATKVFHTIEGGAVSFSDMQLGEALKDLRNFGIRGEECVVSIGGNAKMNEFAAAMGLCNLRHIDHAIEERKHRYQLYRELCKDIPGIKFYGEQKEVLKNYAYLPLLIEDDYGITRDELFALLRSQRIYTRKYFYPLTSQQTCYRELYRAFKLPVAEYMAERVLTLPLYEELEYETIMKITAILAKQV